MELCKSVETMERAVAANQKSGKRELVLTSLPVKDLLKTLGKHFSLIDRLVDELFLCQVLIN